VQIDVCPELFVALWNVRHAFCIGLSDLSLDACNPFLRVSSHRKLDRTGLKETHHPLRTTSAKALAFAHYPIGKAFCEN
jgi:hypothetical protein